MNRTILNPSLIPNWFIYSGTMVRGISGADGREYYFIGSSEKGADGKTPALQINAQSGYKWQVNYDNDQGWVDIPGSPAASGLVGPEGPQGISGDSVKVDSIVNENDGTTVTLAWGENFSATSSFFVPSGLSGANGKDGTDGKDGQNGISPTVTTTTIQPDTTHTNGGIEVTISGADGEHKYSAWNGKDGTGTSLFAGTDLKIVDSIVQVNTNGIANSAGSAFVEGINTVASGIASHAAGKNTSAYSDYSFVEGYQNTDYLITGLIGANHTEGAYNQVSGVYSHIEGHANTLTGYGVHMEGGYNIFKSHNLTADKSDPIGRWNIWGQSVEGMANATSAEPTSGTPGQSDFGYVHGGILKIIGNGTRIKTDDNDPKSEVITRSDALILYRDGSMMVKGPITANGVELGAGGTSYQGRSGVNVADNYIELTQTAYNALTSVSSKVAKPDSSFVNKYLVLRTDNAGNVSGWYDLNEQCYSKSEATGTFQKKTDMTGYLTTAQYATDSSTFVTSSSNTITGTKQYALTTTGWAEITGGSIVGNYIPYSATELPIGTNNTATTNAAAIGGLNSAIDLSFALGNGNSAKTTGCAIGESNYAYNKSVAIGYQNTANYNVDIAIGYQNSAYDHAASLINHNIAKTYSFAAGDCNTAINYSFTFGRGLKLDNTNGGSNSFGGLAIGGWNYTTADAMFVIGNGTPSTKKDYFVLKNDGSVAFGESTSAQFIGSFAEGFHTSAIGVGVRAVGAFTRFSVSNTADHAIYDWEGRGVTVEGYANATTAHPLDGNGNKIHGGILKVIGNGAANSNGITGSDALILYRDGSLSAAGKISAAGVELGGGGSTVTVNPNTNVIKDGTSAISAASYYTNTDNSNYRAQRFFVVTGDQDLINHIQYTNGQGSIYFVVGPRRT